ncbi:MAG TPA: asparagine synthase-related protein [Gemmatimonadaceae bacterium]|nr:asparagine synthase-related protein [Gemmatimonadaceae bacterium]
MTGLAGVISLDGALDRDDVIARLDVLTRTMSHRAPAGWQCAVHSHLASAFARSRGNDGAGAPRDASSTACPDGCARLAVAFAGVLTSRARVRERLENARASASCDDRALLVRAWEHWGAQALDVLDGRFTFAVHDSGACRSYVVRDRFGHLPMHYLVDGDRVYFASEIKPLLAVAARAPVLDEMALVEWSMYGDVLPPRTLFRGIHTLAPGHLLEIGHDTRQVTTRIYHDPVTVVAQERYRGYAGLSIPEALDLVESTIERAVAGHIHGRSGVSVMLSGGVDSSLMAALAARHTQVTGYHFSVANNALPDERPTARTVASHLGIPLVETSPVDGDVYRRELAPVTWSIEMPLWHMQGVPMQLLARRAAQGGAEMLLTGITVGPYLGASYDRMRWISAPRVMQRIPAGAFRVMRKAVYSAAGLPVVNPFFTLTLGSGVHLVDGGARAEMVRRHEEAYRFLSDAERPPLVMRMTDNALFLPRFFHKCDRLCMASSVEYCDAAAESDFQTLAFNAPVSWIRRKGHWKWMLKEIATRHIPREISFQKKIVGDVPADDYFTPQFRPSMFEHGFLGRFLGMKWQTIQRVASVGRDRTAAIFRLVNLETWGRLFLLEQSVQEVTHRLTRTAATLLCAALTAATVANELAGVMIKGIAALAAA